ncbi:hypothetical protein [Corynebacterium sp. 212_CJEI]|uniref:hypothetical protein n=1 Tax=Corynebacterium sp. 212_CJEI TaxID=2715675 RepID=UPI000666894A|nr:hypothetical protein [Corynebacterium sp. 212_CJEI]
MSARFTGGSGGGLLHFSEDAVTSAAREIEQRGREGHERWGSAPDISAADCGQGFAAQGRRLQQAAARLREHGQSMYAGLGNHAPAVREQWRVFAGCDSDGSADLGGIEVVD